MKGSTEPPDHLHCRENLCWTSCWVLGPQQEGNGSCCLRRTWKMCAVLCLFPAFPSLSPASRGAFLVGNWQVMPECQAPAVLHRLQLGCRCHLLHGASPHFLWVVFSSSLGHSSELIHETQVTWSSTAQIWWIPASVRFCSCSVRTVTLAHPNQKQHWVSLM